MDGDRCTQNGCIGIIEDGYCNVCGMAAAKQQLISQRVSAATGSASTPTFNRSSFGSRRTSGTHPRSSRRLLGAGLVSLPELPSTDPELSIISDPKVPDNKRFCSNCNNQLRREKGFCSQCGQKFSFIPTLKPGDVLVGQYEVKGAIAYGGLGWIYLGYDKKLSRYVVLKGLLNTEDASAAAVAVAERQFLAAVKHPQIVGIYNFVNQGTEGFIVMEYVGGKTLKEIRKSRGILPPSEAIAYIHRILRAFAYLHQQGLVYCDFKPDNMMLESSDVKLIDLGGVRRIDDPDGDIYGTVGYSAPEVAKDGPSVGSDLFTVGRTLAVLLANISGFTSVHQYTLPNPSEEPLFAQYESLYRFLLKATANNPEDRFQSADEMADQLLGVLREVVAIDTDIPRPAASNYFGGDMLALTNSSDFDVIKADYQQLPIPTLNSNDPGLNLVANASAISDPLKRTVSLKQIVDRLPDSIEAKLRYANSLIDVGDRDLAEQILAEVEQEDPWDWRVWWYRGRALMVQGKPGESVAVFDKVYLDLPGELAPKLALALAHEQAGNYKQAIKMYELVSRTDPSYVSAAFGLARCLLATSDRNSAVTALERVPQTSNLFTRSRVEVARTLLESDRTPPGTQELSLASTTIEELSLSGMDGLYLTKQVLETALNLLTSQTIQAASDLMILGQPLEEVHLRKRLEQALRDMARLATGSEKIRLVDEANRVRPRTLF